MLKKIVLILLLLAIPRIGESSVPVVFTNGTVADATEVNQNFNYFENKFSLTSGHDHDGTDSKAVLLGEWQGTAVDEQYGGTGQSVYASGDLVFATSDTVLVRLAKPTLGSVLIFGHGRSEPKWIAPGTNGQHLVGVKAATNPVWTDIYAVGNFNHTLNETGNQSVTGAGFRPTAVYFRAVVNTESSASWGFMTSSVQGTIYTNPTTYTADATKCISLYTGGGAGLTADFVSFEDDGFTITWTVDAGSPAGDTGLIHWTAFR